MKRIGNGLYESIISKDNLITAHEYAKRGKLNYKSVSEVESSLGSHIRLLRRLLRARKFSTGKYTIKERVEGGKLREIYSLPYFPDRIVQHAILQKVGDRFVKSFIRDTFQSIKGRGTSDARKRVYRFIKREKPTYYLQMDIRKYYPSVNNERLKVKIRRILKCKDTLGLLDNIIDSCEGLPIGNYTSQVLGNYYLTDFDWFVKQELCVKGYFRYCDDLVFFGGSPSELEIIRVKAVRFLRREGLQVKPDWKITKLNTGCDFVGYQFYESGFKLRKRIYKSAKMALSARNDKSIPSYFGWVKVTKDSRIKRRYYNAIKCKKR